MFAALLTTLLFSISAICGHRTSTRLGGVEANFWRICGALLFLTLWANMFGTGTAGAAFSVFILSGLAGIGLGDTAYFQALPRLGSRRTVLLTQCLTAPFAALIEWLWLGTKLNLRGNFLHRRDSDRRGHRARARRPFENCPAPVVDRHSGQRHRRARRRARRGVEPQGLRRRARGGRTSRPRHDRLPARARRRGRARPRFSGGEMAARPPARRRRADEGFLFSRAKNGKLWPWVLANSLAGQTLGVSCMQWALENTPTGIVTAIIAMTPIVMLPLARIVEGEKITARSLAGGLIAVAGVIGLTFWRLKCISRMNHRSIDHRRPMFIDDDPD